MDNRDKNISRLVKGNLFDMDFLFNNYKLILLLVGIAILSIVSSHSIDNKIYKISKLERDVRELKSEFVSVRTDLMNARMGSNLQDKVKELGLETSKTPPHVIKISTTK